VVALPSVALAAGVPAFSTEEAVVGRPRAALAAPQPPPLPASEKKDEKKADDSEAGA